METAKAPRDFNKYFNSLTPDERAYFIAMTDPFHDEPYNVIGRPSMSRQLQNTVVLNLERSFSRSDFPSVPAGPWDLNVCSMPFLARQIVSSCDDLGFRLTPAATPVISTWGGLMAWGVPPGADTVTPSSNTVPTLLDPTPFFFPGYTPVSPSVKRIFYEVLSIGLELVNATPELYKGGSLIRYRVPTQGRLSSVAVDDPMGNLKRESYSYPLPPSSSKEAMQYPDAVLAPASEGSYQIHTCQDAVSDYYLSGNEAVHFRANDTPGALQGNTWTSASTMVPTTYDYDPPMVRGDFDMVGTYFTGLSDQSVITARYRIVFSSVPSSTDSQLVSLAKVNPEANPKLDALVSHVQSLFPPGVPVSMNPRGEWFRKVMQIAKRVLPKVIPVLSDLAQGDVGSAAQKAVTALQHEVKRVKESQAKDKAEQAKRLTSAEKTLATVVKKKMK